MNARQRLRLDQPALYRIRVQGRLDENWSAWFDGMKIAAESNGHGAAITTLTGTVADQVALHGLLSRIRDLGPAAPVSGVRGEGGGRGVTADVLLGGDREQQFNLKEAGNERLAIFAGCALIGSAGRMRTWGSPVGCRCGDVSRRAGAHRRL